MSAPPRRASQPGRASPPTPQVSLSWDATDSVMLYATYSEGYRDGDAGKLELKLSWPDAGLEPPSYMRHASRSVESRLRTQARPAVDDGEAHAAGAVVGVGSWLVSSLWG